MNEVNAMTDKAKKARQSYLREWREKNKENIREYNKKWRSENREKVKEYQANYWERKAAELEGVAVGRN